jgi:CheY-like chemotaxis protein
MGEPKIDCIVCDYRIPKMNGIEFCRRIREKSDVARAAMRVSGLQLSGFHVEPSAPL